MSNAVTIISDGDYNVEKQDGQDLPRYPFFDKNDGVSFEITREIVVLASKYKPPKPMQSYTTKYGTAYLVNEGEAEKESCGLIRIKRTIASIPQPRNEWSNYTKTFQYLGVGADDTSEFTYTVNARTRYEYGLTPFAPIIAPRLISLFGVIQYVGASNLPHKVGEEFPGQDSECDRYKAGIYYRATIYVKWPI